MRSNFLRTLCSQNFTNVLVLSSNYSKRQSKPKYHLRNLLIFDVLWFQARITISIFSKHTNYLEIMLRVNLLWIHQNLLDQIFMLSVQRQHSRFAFIMCIGICIYACIRVQAWIQEFTLVRAPWIGEGSGVCQGSQRVKGSSRWGALGAHDWKIREFRKSV